MMTELTSLQNIGKTMALKLKSVGIETADQLQALGSRKAFSKLKKKYSNDKAMSLVHLYALEGAVTDTAFNQLSADVKESLKQYCDALKIFGA